MPEQRDSPVFLPIKVGTVLSVARETVRADKYYQRNKAQFELGSKGESSYFRTLYPALRKPVFIVGAARSGTTFLGDSIGQMPSVGYHFEPVATKIATKHVYDEEWSPTFSRYFFSSVFRWLQRINRFAHLRFVQKTPRHCFIVPFLASAFPDSQFIHIIRDGRDAALSDSMKEWLTASPSGNNRREEGGYLIGPYPRFWVEHERREEFLNTSDIHRCIWAWRRYVEAANQACGALGEDRCLELRYEGLVRKPEEHATKIAAFLGGNDQADLRALRAALAHGSIKSVGRWKGGLSADQLQAVNQEAGSLLQGLGYS